MIGSILEAIPFLLKAAPAIKAGYNGVNLRSQKQAADRMNTLAGQQKVLAGAQTDMSSPAFQKLYQQERGAGQQDLAATISEISRQNRKLTALGRNPILDRERGGESIFRNLVQGQEDTGNKARDRTFNQLRLGQNALAGAQDAYGGVFSNRGTLATKDLANKGMNIGANYSLGDALQKLFGLNNQTSLKNGETINWNQPSTPDNWVSYR